MTDPRSKADKEAGLLSETAKSYCLQLAKDELFGRLPTIQTKPMTKGIKCEDESIALYNSVFFTDHKKHSGRIVTDVFSGECDLLDEDIVKDIKTSWNLATFPLLAESAHDDGYEWQLRAYMHLYDRPRAELAFVMVDTPEDLIGYEPPELHIVSHIPAHMRITRVQYERDMALEEKMIARCKKAQAYIAELIERIKKEHA